MKNFNPIKKLLTGLVLLAFGFFMVFQVGEHGWEYCEKQVSQFLGTFLPIKLAAFISVILGIVLAWYSIKSFVSGLYKVLTFRQYLKVYDGDSSGKAIIVHNNGKYPNINRVLGYRESCLASMNQSRAADFLISTSKLDNLYSGYYSGKNTINALDFIESRVSAMSNDRAINYIQGKIN